MGYNVVRVPCYSAVAYTYAHALTHDIFVILKRTVLKSIVVSRGQSVCSVLKWEILAEEAQGSF